TKPKIAPSSGTIITSTSTTNSEIDGFEFIIPTGTNDLLGFISTTNTNPYYTGDVILKNNRYYRNSKRLFCKNELNPYISDANDLSINDYNIGEFIIEGICPTDDTELWLDAANIDQQNGTAVANWDDRSDNDFDATQSESRRQPTYYSSGGINNAPYVTSTDCNNGVNADFMSISSSAQSKLNENTSKMIFVGFRNTVQDSRRQVLFETGDQNNGYNIMIHGSNIYFGIWRNSSGTNQRTFLSRSLSTNTNYLAAMYYNKDATSNNFGYFLNGLSGTGTFEGWTTSDLVPSTNYFSGNAGVLGSDTYNGTRSYDNTLNNNEYWPMCGYITELLVYNKYDQNIINYIIEYFNEKYGTSFSSTSTSSGGKKKKEQNEMDDDFVTINFAGQLSYPYPNPFTNSTNFSVMLNRSQNVTIDLYDALGNKVQSFYKGALEANQIYNYTIDGSNLPPGLYIYRLSGEDFTESGKVVLVK
ncbi:MAG: T9SS type A sorting domain-containing protein, partial [Candidatus Kapabacteria bacterium]|nr:T9SS type A sorting domain-containing protein [Candidatus Kapabacteria bacterium]